FLYIDTGGCIDARYMLHCFSSKYIEELFLTIWMRGEDGQMRSESPIATCTYGWGRVFRLYNDYLEANGARHALNDLTHVRQFYRNVMGIASARLELYFGERKLVLAGIPEIEDAQKTAAYLTMRLDAFHITQQEELAQAVTEEVEIPGGKRMLRDQ